MYEGNILNLGSIAPARDPFSGAEGMHVLSWGELVARLGAARDFRRIIVGDHVYRGSFDYASACHIAALGGGKPGINPFALTNRKATESISLSVMSDTNTCDRGRQ